MAQAHPHDCVTRDEDLEYFGDASVDIIAVHGLASAYETTWSLELDNGKRYC